MVVFNTSSENYTIISPSFTNHHNLITLSTRVSKNIIILRWNQIKIPTKYFVFIRLSKSKNGGDTILIKYLSGKQKFLDICQIRDMNRSVKLGPFGKIGNLILFAESGNTPLDVSIFLLRLSNLTTNIRVCAFSEASLFSNSCWHYVIRFSRIMNNY